MIFSIIDWIFIVIGLIAIIGLVVMGARYVSNLRAKEIEDKALSAYQSEEGELDEDSLGVASNFNAGMTSMREFPSRWARLSQTVGVGIPPLLLHLLIFAVAFSLVWSTSLFFFGNLLYLVIFFVLIVYVIYSVLSMFAHYRTRRFEAALDNAIDVIIAGLATGLNIREAVELVPAHAKGAVRQEFSRALQKVALGFPGEIAFSSMITRYPSEGVYIFLSALSLKWSGSNDTIFVFTSVQGMLRDRRKHSMELRSQLSGARAASVVVSLIPYIFLLFVYFFQPEWITRLTQEPLGFNLLVGAIVIQLFSLIWVRKLLQIQL